MALGTNTVTVNYAGFTASFDVEVKGVTFGLSSLKVDGNAVADFDIATKEYNVVIPSTQVKFPVVDAVATEGGLVSVTNPTEFPGKATVKVTKTGEEDAVYTLNYVFDKEIVENVNILGDNKIPEVYGGGNVSAKPKYRKGGFVVGTPAYSDREDRTEGGARYSVLEITDSRLVGGDYITGGITWYNGSTPTVKAFTSTDTLDWLQFTVNRDATVYVLKHHNNDKEKFESYGYTQSVSDNDKGYLYTLLNGSNHRYHKYMYSKKVTAGTKVIVPNSQDNNNMYHTIITYDSYEELKPQAPSLSGIEITSKPTKLTYTEGEEIDLTGLKVKANYSDNSFEEIDTYTVSECDMSVGKHTITVTYEGYTATFEITVEALPEEIFGLTALTVDGTAVKNVSSIVYEYNVTIPANQKEVPLVEATVSEGATYEVTDPETFPGSVTVTVSADGKEDAVYTINYVLDNEVISNIDYGSVAKGATGHSESLLPVVYKNFSVGATPAMYDRNAVLHNSNSSVTAIGDEGFIGKDYFGVSFGWVHSPPYRDLYNGDYVADWWHFDVNRDAKLTLLVQNNSGDFHDDLIADGFVLDATKADYAKILVGTSNNYTYSYKYTKTVSAGETITLGSNKTSRGYFILIDYAGYGEESGEEPEQPEIPEEPEVFGLTGLKIDDNAVADVNADILTYNVGIPANQAAFPVVEATVSEGATYEITDPEAFPGSVTLTVSKDGEEDKVYTINYITSDLLTNLSILGNNTIPEAYGGGAAKPLPEYTKNGFVVGAYAYNDRKERTENGTRYVVLEINDESLVGADYITGGITWYNGSTNTIKAFTGEETLDWVQFKVMRNAKVHVLKFSTTDASKLTGMGYTETVSDNQKDYMYTLLNGTNNRYHKYMYTKEYEAGETVIVPNAKDGQNTYHIVVTYDNYQELEG